MLLDGVGALSIRLLVDVVLLGHANVVVGELAHLAVVNTDNLRLLGRAETQEGNEVHHPANDRRHDEGVCEASGGVGKLVAKLDPVVVDPASIDGGQAIVESDALFGKETSQEVANNASDTVSSEDIETVVIAEDTLELGCKIAKRFQQQHRRRQKRECQRNRKPG